MTHTRTAISIESSLLERTDRKAEELSMSRSRFVAAAVERYLKYLESKAMFSQINAVCEEISDYPQPNWRQSGVVDQDEGW